MKEIKLYAFQERGLDAGRASYARGRRAVLFVGPTGMGKTTLASAAAVGHLERGGKNVVAIAHRKELVDQMAARLTLMGLDVGSQGLRPSAPVQVTSIQTILARGTMPDASFVIVDEAHHYVSNQWIRPISLYLEHGAKIMGLTATPCRDDGRGLGGDVGPFDDLIVVAQVRELVALHAREPDKGITPIRTLEATSHVRKLALDPHVAYTTHCPGRSCVVFSPNVKSAHHFSEGFKSIGIDAPVVIGDPKHGDRSGNLERFASGEIKVIVNVNVLTEGWDAPICDVAMLARKIGSFSLLVQMIGRARRPYPGKREALLIDLSGNLATHDFDPDDEIAYSLDGAGMSAGGAGAGGPRVCRKCKRVLDEDIEAANARGVELTHCPECKTKLSKIVVPTSEEIALARIERDAARAKLPHDKRTKILATLYLKGIREGRKRGSAEFAYRSMFHGFPPTEVRAPAWKAANALYTEERGGHWSP